MKKTFKTKIAIIVTLAIATAAGAHSQDGLFRTSEEFMHSRVMFTDSGKPLKIRLHDFLWSMPTVTVVADGKKQTFQKAKLYGYREHNVSYRFFNNSEYRIEDTGKVIIYSQTRNIPLSKGYKVEKAYYYSATPDGELLPLNQKK